MNTPSFGSVVRAAACASLSLIATMLMAPVAHTQGTVAATPVTRADTRALDSLLSRQVTAHVTRVSLKRAINVLATNARLSIQYNARIVDAYTNPVTLDVSDTPLRTALDHLLAGTRLAVTIDGMARLVIVDQQTLTGVTPAPVGIVEGRVTDAKTTKPMQGVTVTLDDSVRRTRTDENGWYHFPDVAAGRHRITARYVGFGRQTKFVTVVGDSVATANIALEAGVNTLDQVVVTATGEQRVRELGHIVATINADSLVKESPITNLAELLQSRVPGLQVITGSGGVAGGEIALRLRGTSTFNLDPEPIVIVDGIRYKSNNLIANSSGQVAEDIRGNGNSEARSPLNDLNVNDIETVKVVKGPSASTLYGPDASNGVIVITTKRGKSGKPEFHWYARPVSNSVPTEKSPVRRGYRAWGHDDTGALFHGNCTLVAQYQYHACTLDSITVVPNIVTNDDASVIAKSRPTWQYGASAGGGTGAFKYYVSGNYDSQTGAVQVPKIAQQLLEQKLGVSSLSDAVKTPNTEQSIGAHATVSTDFTSRGNLSVVTTYTQAAHRSADLTVFSRQYQSGITQPGADTLATLTGSVDPNLFLQTTGETDRRFTGGVNGTAQLVPWLTLNGFIGIDLGSGVTHTILPPGETSPDDGGVAEDDRRDNISRTVNLGATTIAHPGIFSFRSSVGVQYIYSHLDGLNSVGYNLAPGSTSIGTATQTSVTQLWGERITLGTYGEEVVGWRDRLFLTGSLRLDGATSFGDAYHPHPYPKIGASWIASEEPFLKNVPGLNELRLRWSYGAASRYPTSGMKLGQLGGELPFIDGQRQHTFYRVTLANPYLHAERSSEAEYGADITTVGDVQVGLTWYRRRTLDQLQYLSNPTGLQAIWANTSSDAAHGFEATVTVPVMNSHAMRADLAFSYSFSTDRLLSLGALPEYLGPTGGYAVGYPIGAVFGRRILGVADTVGGQADGIILSREVIRDSVSRFLGVAVPPRTYTFTPSVTLLGGALHLSTLFDRQTGFLVFDGLGPACGDYGLCAAPYLTSTPALVQAKFTANYMEDFLVPGDFTRWREFNVALQIPPQLLRINALHIRFSQASVSLQGRNLAIWTRYQGPDPESHSDRGNLGADAVGIPQARAWSLRFDITP